MQRRIEISNGSVLPEDEDDLCCYVLRNIGCGEYGIDSLNFESYYRSFFSKIIVDAKEKKEQIIGYAEKVEKRIKEVKKIDELIDSMYSSVQTRGIIPKLAKFLFNRLHNIAGSEFCFHDSHVKELKECLSSDQFNMVQDFFDG